MDDTFLTCEYRIGNKACGKPAQATVTIDVLDSENPPSSHHYCKQHGHFAESDIILAVVARDRLDQVKVKLDIYPFPLERTVPS